MMKCVVTGGAGFIGSHLVDALVAKGDDVTVIDDFSEGRRCNINHLDGKIRVVEGSILNLEMLLEEFKDKETVFHQAAKRNVPNSFPEIQDYTRVNVNGTTNVLEAARISGVKKIVFASSSSVYGEAEMFPQNEDDTTMPISPYALNKLYGEHLMRIYNKTYGIQAVSLRYFNVFGPRQDPNSPYAVVVPLFIKKMLEDEDIIIHGTGDQSRDFTYVDNVVEANLLAAEKQVSGVFNAALGNTYSINQLANTISSIIGKEYFAKHELRRAGDPMKSQADITRAKNFLGYQGRVSFEDGLRKTISYFTEVMASFL